MTVPLNNCDNIKLQGECWVRSSGVRDINHAHALFIHCDNDVWQLQACFGESVVGIERHCMVENLRTGGSCRVC